MKERPILMSAPMVRSTLADIKNQTRRVAPIERLDIKEHDGGFVTWSIGFTKPIGKLRTVGSHSGSLVTVEQARSIIASQFCPYGQPGDRLWVKETWCTGAKLDSKSPKAIERQCRDAGYKHGACCPVRYLADGHATQWGDRDADDFGTWGKTRVSIHMPRWASRITLEVNSVRVERLQDISEADAIAEGIARLADGGYGLPDGSHYHATDPRISYLSLWGAINGQESVDANPFVWVIEFARAP